MRNCGITTDDLEFFRAKSDAEGVGYQTLIDATLRASVDQKQRKPPQDKPLTMAILRKVLREELHS